MPPAGGSRPGHPHANVTCHIAVTATHGPVGPAVGGEGGGGAHGAPPPAPLPIAALAAVLVAVVLVLALPVLGLLLPQL